MNSLGKDITASILLHLVVFLVLIVSGLFTRKPPPPTKKVTMVTAMAALPRKGPDSQMKPSHIAKKTSSSKKKSATKKKTVKTTPSPPKPDQMSYKKKEKDKKKETPKKEKKEKNKKKETPKKEKKVKDKKKETNLSEREKLMRELKRKEMLDNFDGDEGKKDVKATAKDGTKEKLPKHAFGNSKTGNELYGKYKREITKKVKKNWFLLADDKVKKYVVTISLQLLDNGSFGSPKIVKSSGRSSVDSAALRAVAKAGGVTAPPQGFPRRIKITLSSKN